MRVPVLLAFLALPALLLPGCFEAPVVAVPDDALLSRAPGAGPASELQNFVAPLSGEQEVPAVDTKSRGLANFQLSKDGETLHFRLNVANIQDVRMAHIHCGAPGVNGPVVVWLYPEGPPPQLIEGRTSGVLASGPLTEANVTAVGDSEECPDGVETLDDVLERMRIGEAYVNVHTVENPGGEIRGVIHARGPHS